MVGACMAGGMCGRAMCMVGACVAGEMAIVADGMHPTGMHSCFTGVCQSFCPQGSLYDVTSWLAAWSRVHFRAVSVQRVSVGETPPDRDPPHCTMKSGRYSYWNAFLLTFILNLKVLSLF